MVEETEVTNIDIYIYGREICLLFTIQKVLLVIETFMR